MDIDKLFAELHSLPSIPQVALELAQQFDNPNESVEKVARNIERDPVIAAKVLRLANSARFKGARESASIEDAAMRLGFNVLRTLVLASAVTGAFKSAPGFDLKLFWGRSFQVASISRLLARQAGLDGEVAFTCGVMHDIGELLIQTGAPEYAARIKGASGTTSRAASETQQLGFGYPEVGAELGKRWNLPQTIQSAIRYQAQPHQAPDGQPYARIIAQAMEICDALEQHGGPGVEARNALGGPLFEGVDLDGLFEKLPVVLEQDKAFADFLA
ncbi:HDOD domain-containing protein [Pseudomonas sp. 148P]|uniref:HDOD domain-containing protein n=1 Tax=Pseudomonas ulcerans TaxID=3115852 RepID=A0ABU7HP45_9PSED|nr:MULTISPECIES: HDOD domain-containing protein [unclassified Pseudomonas]MEE1920507.1 HDOD domain-containing protein [Pseudomonas sp. 147P]MEE1933289.1 HDOD domain-containing protein [Pseudomonas sp. 148P]